MIAKIQIYDNEILKSEYVMEPSKITNNGISTDYLFSFIYCQLNSEINRNGMYSNRTSINISDVKGVNADGGWGCD